MTCIDKRNLSESKPSSNPRPLWPLNAQYRGHKSSTEHRQVSEYPHSLQFQALLAKKERSKKNGTSSSQSGNLQTKQQVLLYKCWSGCYNIASTAVVFIEKMVQLFGPKKSSWLRSPGESGSKYVNVTKPRCAWSGNPSGNATVKSCGATGRLNSFHMKRSRPSDHNICWASHI